MVENQENSNEQSNETQYHAPVYEYNYSLERAKVIVRRHMYISGGLGLIPVPLADLAGVGANQIYMVKLLSDVYEIPFRRSMVKSLISTLLSTLAAQGTIMATSSLFKSIPVIGSVGGSLTVGVYSAATTYAIGKVFTMHFESGGNFLNFDPEKMKDHFQQEFEEGKKMAEDRQNGHKTAASTTEEVETNKTAKPKRTKAKDSSEKDTEASDENDEKEQNS